MAFRRIEEVHIGSNPPGMAFGGYVYDLKINFGFNGGPTTVIVNVINEDGIYPLNPINAPAHLRSDEAVSIWISEYGDPVSGPDLLTDFIALPMMHLVEYTIQRTADAKILTLEYVDHSILLDKIWVGLARRSAQTHNLSVLHGGFPINEYQFKERIMTLPIRCHPCSKYKRMGKHGNVTSVGVREDGQEPELNDYKIPYMAGGGFVSNIHWSKGGALLIGTEEFTALPCSTPNVTYTWNDLEYALAKNNIFINGIHNRNKPDYRNSHADKSLKEVINSWCQELGFDWTWNPMTNQIIGRDLIKAHAVNLDPVRFALEGWTEKSGEKSIITSMNESCSIKNTKVQDHISAYIKPMREKNYSDTRYKRVFHKNIKLENVVPAKSFGMGRTISELMISCALSKYDQNARQIYNLLLVNEKFGMDDGWQPAGGLEPLGLERAYKFTDDEAKILALLFYNPGNVNKAEKKKDKEKRVNQFWSDFERKYIDSHVFLATVNPELESKWLTWEKSLADKFFGRHYVSPKSHEDFITCTDYEHYQLDVSSHAAGVMDVFNINSLFDYPFENLLRGAPCATLEDCAQFANTYKMVRGCWGDKVADQAWKNTKCDDFGEANWSMGPQDPNNSCCGYTFGIKQGEKLTRGKTYQFAQFDKSWKPWDNWNQNCDAGQTQWFMDGCIAKRGGKIRIVTEGGVPAPGYSYDGVPGINGVATYAVPGGPDGEIVYLTQDAGANIGQGCNAVRVDSGYGDCSNKPYAFINGKNAYGSMFKERWLELGDDPDKDSGKEMFYFDRQAKWGVTEEALDELMTTAGGAHKLESIMMTKYIISEQIKNNVKKRFKNLAKDQNDPKGVKNIEARLNTSSPATFGEVVTMLDTEGKDTYIVFIPKKKVIERKFKISTLRAPKTKNPYESIYSKDEDDPEVTSCKTACEVDFISRVCRCWPGEDFDIPPEVNGLLSNRAHSFFMSVHEEGFELDEDGAKIEDPDTKEPMIIDEWSTSQIIFPSFADYAGYHQYDIQYRQVVRSIIATAGLLGNGGNALSYAVHRSNITNDLDWWNPDPSDKSAVIADPINEEGSGGAGQGLPGWKGGGKMVANIIVPTAPGLNATQMHVVPIEFYHQELLKEGHQINNQWPSQSLDFVVVGGYVAPLHPFLSPEFGLESLSISYGAQGLQTSFRFASRYPAPVPDQMAHQRIEPHINLNIFGRTS